MIRRIRILIATARLKFWEWRGARLLAAMRVFYERDYAPDEEEPAEHVRLSNVYQRVSKKRIAAEWALHGLRQPERDAAKAKQRMKQWGEIFNG